MTDDDFAATPKMRIKKKTVGFFFTPCPSVAQTQPLGICGMT